MPLRGAAADENSEHEGATSREKQTVFLEEVGDGDEQGREVCDSSESSEITSLVT